jgi:hypothetical protein
MPYTSKDSRILLSDGYVIGVGYFIAVSPARRTLHLHRPDRLIIQPRGNECMMRASCRS